MICLRGHAMPDSSLHCSICGSPPTVTPVVIAREPTAGLATAALVLGIIGLLGSVFLIGLPFAITAIVLGGVTIGRRLPGRGMGIAGLVLGIIGTVGALLLIVAVITLALLGIDLDAFAEQGVISR
jgi:hypothetical protein